VKAAHEKALGILRREKALLERWAQRLLEKETLGEAELQEIKASLTP
jgi:ATP-dependent Zn protease